MIKPLSMRKQSLVLLTLLCTTLLKAQQPKVYTLPHDKFSDTTLFKRFNNKSFIDSLQNALRYKNGLYGNKSLAGAMPRHLNYIGNNGNGFDIYQTPQDNMYILKPDASFTSNMPVAKIYDADTKPVEMPNAQKEKR